VSFRSTALTKQDILLAAFDRQPRLRETAPTPARAGLTQDRAPAPRRADLSRDLELGSRRGARSGRMTFSQRVLCASVRSEKHCGTLTYRLDRTVPPGDLRIALPALASAGLQSSLLEPPTGIRQAEQDLISANGQIGWRRRSFSTITLTGEFGGESKALRAGSTVPGSMWTFAAGLSNRSSSGDAHRLVDVQRARSSGSSLANYQRTIQTAFREVADALITTQYAGARETTPRQASTTLATHCAREHTLHGGLTLAFLGRVIDSHAP